MTEYVIIAAILFAVAFLALGLQIRKLERDIEQLHAVQVALIKEIVTVRLKVEKK